MLQFIVVYPGLSLGIQFFAKCKSKGSWESRSLGYRGKVPGKKLMFTFRESFKLAQMFIGSASSLKMIWEHQNQ